MHVSKVGLLLNSNGFLVCLLLQIVTRASAYEGRYSGKPISAAINSRHSVSVKKVDLPSMKPYSPETIEVKGAVPSFVIKFNSASSRVNLFHEHQSEKVPLPKESYSEDEPQILRHEVSKPIIQEVHEIITPYRKVIQEIKPVQEQILTIVAKDGSSRAQAQGAGEDKQFTASLFPPSTSKVDSLPFEDNPPSPVFGKRIPLRAADEEEEEKSVEQAKPDLMLDEENLIDNSLYNGNSEIELKYVSPNGKSVLSMAYNDVEPKLYKDR